MSNYGILSNGVSTAGIGASFLASVEHTGSEQRFSFSKNPYSSTVTWVVTQSADVRADIVINYPEIQVVAGVFSYDVVISPGTPCNILFFVR